MIGAFVGYYAINSLKMNFWIALVFSMIVCAILGVVIEFLAYRPLRNSTRISALITAIGVSFFLEYIMVYFVGADTRSFNNQSRCILIILVQSLLQMCNCSFW